MALSNGEAMDMTAPPSETATFRIGGRDLVVPALTLWDLEISREQITSMSPDMSWSEYAANVIKVVAAKLKPDHANEFAESLQKSCSVREARELATQFSRLLFVSGFDIPDPDAPVGEDSATVEHPGIGTLTESSQNSPSPSDVSTPTSSSVQ